ncbi:hypothetical protein GCM10009098_13610 [Rheinheimera aquimaris]|uniref:Methylamine utilization protein MauE n=1 Tax=Rheinheimera aquimaris TaxID=412437 RepID=A0ABN1DMK0_9GAMM|nr:MauE/DoxX family redox-associated membrane protein [Rheinheimera aquimaris]MCB5213204.1 hypothetical protein [Rheinheimera aquimaris]
MISYAPFLAELLRFYLGFILLAAAWGKSRTYTYFLSQLTESFLIPPAVSRAIAPCILLLEWVLALGILLLNSRWAIAVAAVLFTLFSLVLLQRYVSAGAVKCSCFGETDRPVTDYDLMRNGWLIAVFLGCFWLNDTAFRIATPLQLLAAGLAVLVALITVNFSDIMLQLFDTAEAGR